MIRTLVIAILLLACLPATVAAQAYPVDDSASQVLDGNVRMRWDDPVPRPGVASTMSGRMTVVVRLDVSPWLGRSGRIYKKLAPQVQAPVRAQWTSRGVLQPGQLRDGERTLVYSGPIMTPMLEDTLHVTLQADGDRLPDHARLEFTFEIELESPQ
ncbi:MAG TPA: hypothetical protein VFQ84_08610 [Arenimonas sp.]|uniref:hypothetical protein n=1 Tax=Arenimonas sp. TaxID=1872635 RepID=UPI002D803358|nr:hypothetical protein [Arenimonas sp.]HEU0153390.1 hypothetical protein [Arenimonas sp.]